MIRLPKCTPRILAKHVVVRPYIPWYLRLLVIGIATLLLLALSWGMYITGSRSTKSDHDKIIETKPDQLYDSSKCLEKNTKELCTLLAKFSRQLQMKNTSHQGLAKQVKSLGEENDHLREELSYFRKTRWIQDSRIIDLQNALETNGHLV